MYKNDLVPSDAAAITKSDTTELGLVGLYVGGTGDVVVTTEKGNDVTFSSVPAGTLLPLRIRKVKVATSATNMVGFKA